MAVFVLKLAVLGDKGLFYALAGQKIGRITSTALKKVVTELLILLTVSFAINVMLYWPIKAGIAKIIFIIGEKTAAQLAADVQAVKEREMGRTP